MIRIPRFFLAFSVFHLSFILSYVECGGVLSVTIPPFKRVIEIYMSYWSHGTYSLFLLSPRLKIDLK